MFTNKEIRKAFVYSFIKRDASFFIPFLLSKNVYVDYWNKTTFYKIFKFKLLKLEAKNGIGKITFERQNWAYYSDYTMLNIYDNFHQHPRFSILFKDVGEKIYLEFNPF